MNKFKDILSTQPSPRDSWISRIRLVGSLEWCIPTNFMHCRPGLARFHLFKTHQCNLISVRLIGYLRLQWYNRDSQNCTNYQRAQHRQQAILYRYSITWVPFYAALPRVH